MICCPAPLTSAAFEALDKAERVNFNWADVAEMLRCGSGAVWQIGEDGYALTNANTDGEVEVLAAGGMKAREKVAPWEACMKAHPAHKGMTLVIRTRRKGWVKLLPHWKHKPLGNGYHELSLRVD